MKLPWTKPDVTEVELAEPCRAPNPWDGYTTFGPYEGSPCGRPKGHGAESHGKGSTWAGGHSELPGDDDPPTKTLVLVKEWMTPDEKAEHRDWQRKVAELQRDAQCKIAELQSEVAQLRERCASLVRRVSAPKHPTYATCKDRHPEQLSYDQDDGAICFSDEHPPIRYSERP